MAEVQGFAVLATVLVGLLAAYILHHRPVQSQSSRTRMPLKIEALYFYPVKGLGGCRIKTGQLGPLGFEDDRVFCLQKVHRDPDTQAVQQYETMYSGFHLRMVLFSTLVEDDGQDKYLVITWTGPENPQVRPGQQVPWAAENEHQIRLLLRPDFGKLEKLHLDLHGASTDAYDMGEEISAWFSKYLGFEARLAYIGKNSRPVLGSGAPHSDLAVQKRLPPLIYRLRQILLPPSLRSAAERISFADIGQFLVVTTESNDEVSRRIREESDGAGLEMDVTKFRPNIVVSGSPAPFDEDYWAELVFAGGLRMALTGNCWRCQAITVDYDTGKPAADARGLAWKKLNRDRRVDKGWKYSPVFGRYGYCGTSEEGKEICAGDEVVLTRRNKERAVFDWPLPKAVVSLFKG